jgi:hypothetical protein
MEVKELIVQKIESVPEPYLMEILDFVRFLETKALEQGMGTALASETSLRKDWMRPEEDEAWRDL